jgi:type III secretion protein L
MVIWLSRPRHAHAEQKTNGTGKDRPRVGLTSDILPRETFGALMKLDDLYGRVEAERQAILAAAQIEREQMLLGARADVAALLEEAARERERATEQGYAEGLVRGEAQWLERIAALTADAGRLQKGMRQRMAQLVMLAVEQLVGAAGSEALFKRATEAIDRIVEGSSALRVSVHPHDLETARNVFGAFEARLRELGRPVSLSVVGDPQLAAGACVCESDLGIVDASRSTQLDAMRAAIERALKGSLKLPANMSPGEPLGEPLGGPADEQTSPASGLPAEQQAMQVSEQSGEQSGEQASGQAGAIAGEQSTAPADGQPTQSLAAAPAGSPAACDAQQPASAAAQTSAPQSMSLESTS